MRAVILAVTLVAVGSGGAGQPSLLQMAPPIAGLKAAEVRDVFQESHSGHPHEALDLMASRGTPVHAVVAGTIAKLFLSKPGGNTIYQFDEARVYCYYYAHLDSYAKGIEEGSRVRQGDLIGYVGSTGNARPDAPHLHFAVFVLGPEKQWWKGQAINPYSALLAAIERRR